ncbi:hypothetical protein [Dyadobacter sandarakinus]|uniref:Uncharacterized protein n=1 Tax=Dyadobacter sandarakinus TaxID=2747268 RepID=A0ABX7I512_9BACT|nr:hypothetical protein [Dyadobacter sandarakinus]QRR00880.1 hypothetical protein HWI92_08170 [Dyadobacter sandarakinus]
MLNTDFAAELTQWIVSRTAGLNALHETAESGICIQVYAGNLLRLEVLAMSPAQWQHTGSEIAWKKQVENVRRKRAEGTKCVIVWENDWIFRREVVASRLDSMLGLAQGIAGRLTRVVRIDRTTALTFLDKNHLNRPIAGKYRYALVLPQRYYRTIPDTFSLDRSAERLIVAVATFSHARVFLKDGKSFRSLELLRFASLRGTHVTGGLSKLLNAFILERQPGDIMTYADLEWSDGESYRQAQFTPVSELPPIAFDIDPENGMRVPAAQPRYPELAPVWNAGSIKFVRKVEND